ncbi:hypothetical protein SLNWT_2247 [Streptomyces albus]|uniref:Uncharacterized protein n=1 Tax=Streptomyces albus (strain ATCC 21838 / DSM 41398 / FERM P-419 / JCM 4703 / NBRC 107858) TaxID=1081613 RepID=A0A0B5EJZ8_STRA4|nr:hypothetical protein SLNWT_2247 [Streptomyces albus]AOU76936.1 hypothetical protein SLNHY_2245 [Streptomyces albus]AYN32714.1 hypothetical protein DUI70_2211 [Streptomyces albus]
MPNPDDDLLHEAAASLHTAFSASQLDGLPTPYADRGRIALGALPVPAADQLASLLNAEPAPTRTELPDWPEGHRIVQRLRDALREALGNEFVDVDFVPYCPRCDEDPAITLGSLSPVAARNLTRALHGPRSIR